MPVIRLVVFAQFLFAFESMAVPRSLRKAVFKINVISQEPIYSQPWRRQASSASSGTGFYIGDGKVMTNAHVVAHGKYITIQNCN